MTAKLIDLSLQRVGRLLVLSYAGRRRWNCVCDCGEHAVVLGWRLRQGVTKSCGCFLRDSTAARKTIHGMARSREYRTWGQMKVRCLNPTSAAFGPYGGRGISVCDRWMTFQNFYADMGPRPPGTSLDRIDVNGNYEPGNCRWATSKEQNRNRRDNAVFTYLGVTAPISELAERFEVIESTVRTRLKAGASIEVAMQRGRLPRNTIQKSLRSNQA